MGRAHQILLQPIAQRATRIGAGARGARDRRGDGFQGRFPL
eukprot:SAG11_NODE_36432_length_261_cov_1.271605_1_plen_40_part_10